MTSGSRRLHAAECAFRNEPSEGGDRRPRFGVGVWASIVVVATSANAFAQADVVLTLPHDMRPGTTVVHEIQLDVGSDALLGGGGGPVPLGVADLGDVSTNQGSAMVARTLSVVVYTSFPFLRPYSISARTLSVPVSSPGGFSARDVGLGVIDIVATNPQVNRDYDYDPRLVGKNVDDEPFLQGTVESLGPGLPRTQLFRTRGVYFGQTNSFRLVFATGPQFYTVSGPQSMNIELAVSNP